MSSPPSSRILLCVVTVALLAATFLVAGSDAFALDPTDHEAGDAIPIMANSLQSLQDLVPYDYYHGPFCAPPVIYQSHSDIGSIIIGDIQKTSPYVINMKRNETCKVVACGPKDLDRTANEIKELTRLIEDGYRGFLSLEDLPIFNSFVSVYENCGNAVPAYQNLLSMRGYALGVHHNCMGKTLINNHIHFIVQYHTVEVAGKVTYRVVGFKGVPSSINFKKSHRECNDKFDPLQKHVIPLTVEAASEPGFQMKWSYTVTWIERPDVHWATRWDEFLSTTSTYASIPWRYTKVIIFLTAAFAVLRRTLLKDFARNTIKDAEEQQEEQQEEVGWKLVHADVFRAPHHAKLLCVAVGNGTQLLGMVVSVLFFSLLGFLSPANRGMLLSCILFMYVVMAVLGGYTCGKLMKMFDQKDWKYVFLSGAGLPGAVLLCFSFVNFHNWHSGAYTIPLTSLFMLFSLLFAVNIPLTICGAISGFNQPAIEPVTKIAPLAREIPAQRSFHSAPFIYVIPPLLPINCCLVEIFLLFRSLWLGRVYNAFGFLTLAFILWSTSVVLTTVVVVYYRLTYENHKWWWSSFIVPGCLGAHFFAFALYYFFTELPIKGAMSVFLYLSFCAFVSIIYGLVAGTIGFLSSLVFVRRIYASIRLD